MHRTMTSRRPTSALPQKRGVVDFANENASTTTGDVSLRMTSEAKVGITLCEHRPIHGSMRLVTDNATFAHRLVFESKRARLFAVTGGAGFIHARHRQPALGFESVAAVRIMALHAVHPVFQNGVMLRQLEFRMRRKMAFEAGG